MAESKIKRFDEIEDEEMTAEGFYKQILKCDNGQKYAVYFYTDVIMSINFTCFETYEEAKTHAVKLSKERAGEEIYLKEIENGELFFETQWYKGKKYIDQHETYIDGKRWFGSAEDFADADIKTQVEFIDSLGSWDEVDPEFYECICDELDLDYDSYDDIDIMWNDVERALKK